VDGRLVVYKGSEATSPSARSSNLGSIISVLSYYNLKGMGLNTVVVVTATGLLHLFDFNCEKEGTDGNDVRPLITLSIPFGATCALVVPHCGSMGPALFIGTAEGSVVAISINNPSIPHSSSPTHTHRTSGTTTLKEDTTKWMDGCDIDVVGSWTVEGKVSSLAVASSSLSDDSAVLVGLEIGNVVVIDFSSGRGSTITNTKTSTARGGTSGTAGTTSNHQVISVGQASVSIAGGFKDFSFCVGTLSGILHVYTIDKGTTPVKLWENRINEALFAVERCDIFETGDSHVVTCAWNGRTHITDVNTGSSVSFNPRHNVGGFAAGRFALQPKSNDFCLFYLTFDGRIRVYTDLKEHLVSSLQPLPSLLSNLSPAAVSMLSAALKSSVLTAADNDELLSFARDVAFFKRLLLQYRNELKALGNSNSSPL
jgi:hypothetical protein